MPSIRKTKTGSGATAIQIVQYKRRKVVVLKHIGSARSKEEIDALIESATAWIVTQGAQPSLFPARRKRTLSLSTARYLGARHTFAYSALTKISQRCGFHRIKSPLLLDLVFMRIIEPTSKLRAIMLLKRYFGISYAERSVYRALPKLKEQKANAEQIAVSCAKRLLASDFALILYDVTTLYFETFAADGLRIPGFSKDSKSQQPQIVIGLLVTLQGYPLGYEVFKGNTFEGHTMIPVLEAFAAAHGVATPTVVADAAMLSRANVAELSRQGLSYIVGARTGSLSSTVIRNARKELRCTDGATIRLETSHSDLIVGFSIKRYRKDKAEMEKQIVKSGMLVKKGEPGKRAKFVKRAGGKDAYVLNENLIARTTLLLGLKGYYTNIPREQLSDQDIIARYHDLWHVEQVFRMAKSDIATRPVFHYKEDAVRAHMVICFVALALGKYMEIITGLSLRKITDILWSVTDALIVDTVTREEFTLRSELTEDVRALMKKLGLSY